MVYSEVYNMMDSPENYLGKTVRMRGPFAFAEGDGRYYFACIISDATSCCAQGIEFIPRDERVFPDEYPEKGKEITVVGCLTRIWKAITSTASSLTQLSSDHRSDIIAACGRSVPGPHFFILFSAGSL